MLRPKNTTYRFLKNVELPIHLIEGRQLASLFHKP